MPEVVLLPLIEVIRAHGLEPKKGLGQHFLLDPGLLAKIAASARIPAGAHVVEVGPGPGGLTRALLQTQAAKVTVIEKDSRCIAALSTLREHYPQLEIIEADALKAALPEGAHIVSNLPYNVGTELLVGWLERIHGNAASVPSMTLMFQKEVADRVLAKEGGKDRGRLSVLAQWLCAVEHVMDIPAGAFYPPPKVTSSLIRLTPYATPLVTIDRQALSRTLLAAFTQRRKMLRASLKSLDGNIESKLKTAGIDPTLRPETLSIQQWGAIAALTAPAES